MNLCFSVLRMKFKTGQLTLVRTLDFEMTPSFTLVVEAVIHDLLSLEMCSDAFNLMLSNYFKCELHPSVVEFITIIFL